MPTEIEPTRTIQQKNLFGNDGRRTTNYQLPITNYQSPNRLIANLHLLILLTFLSLAVIYSLVTPPFEAGDESRHYAVVKYMAETGRLIVQNVPETAHLQHHWSHEGNQPPLYYALAAGLTAWIDSGGWDEVFWYNPHTTIGDPLRPDNKNITIHPPGAGWQGHSLAVRLIRFLSIAMAAVTVLTVYAIALHLFRGNRWLAAGAMAITAFNPMFIFIAASVNNDNAVIMFVTLALWLMVRMGEPTPTPLNPPESGGKLAPPPPRGRLGGGLIDDHPPLRGKLAPPSPRGRLGGGLIDDHPPLRGKLAPPPPRGRLGGGLIKNLSPLRAAALLGLLIGLGALSKLYAFGLLPLAGLLLVWLAYRKSMNNEQLGNEQLHNSLISQSPNLPITNYQLPLTTYQFWRNLLLWNGVLMAVFLAVAGWFYLRNALIYDGDIFALQVMRETAGQRQEAPSLATIRAEFEGFRIAYWGLFGGVNILAAPWIYKIIDAVTLIATVGVIAYTVRFTIYDLRFTIFRPSPHLPISSPTFLILLLWYLIMLAGFILWNLTQPAGQGRLMYPAIAAISAFTILGLTWWLPKAARRWVALACGSGLFIFAVLAPFLYIAPAYARPPLLTEADLPADIQPVNFVYDGKMRLIGYRLEGSVFRPAETVPLTLYWELLEPTDLDYSIFVHLLGRQRAVIGQVDTYPGGGHWPTTLLQPGDIIADRYAVPISPQAESGQAPTRLQIAAGIYDFNEAGRPGKPALNAEGQPVEPIIARAKLIPWQWPDPPRFETTVNFFDKATLLSYVLSEDQQTLTLNWEATQPFETDYTVFIQAWDVDSGDYAAGFDGPPVRNDYPTSLWEPGEIIVDAHPLDLSLLESGRYELRVGLYNPASGERLPAFGPDGPLPDYALTMGTLQIDGSKE